MREQPAREGEIGVAWEDWIMLFLSALPFLVLLAVNIWPVAARKFEAFRTAREERKNRK